MTKSKPRSRKLPRAAKRAAKPTRRARPAKASSPRPRSITSPRREVRRATGKPAKTVGSSKWLRFVERHGVVLASAHGPVPSVADAIAGEPIVGSWWAHPRAQAIFDALSAIDDDEDVRCFKLVDGKVTFVHRRVWPALVRLARDGVISPGRVASVAQVHLPTGEHRNLITPYPDWVPDEVAEAADELSAEQARAQLGTWA